jgi:ADP-heptose:LPS heptosyltransferase
MGILSLHSSRLLLIRFGGLGDLLVALPSLRLIRRMYPHAHLSLACRETYGRLLAEAGVVDEIIPEDSPRLLSLFDEGQATEAESAGGLGPFDLVIGWTHGGRAHFAKTGMTRIAASGEILFLSADPRGSSPLSRQFFRKTADAIGTGSDLSIEEYAVLPADRPRDAERSAHASGRKGGRRGVVIHPGSGSESKRWPLENFLVIVSRLRERGVTGSLVTGEAEERTAAVLEKTVLPPSWTWLRQPGLTDLVSNLTEAVLYLGNDSGVTHLAAACGAEVIALFRQDLVTAWRPLGRVHPLTAPSLPEIPIESVWKIIVSRLPNFSAYSQNS